MNTIIINNVEFDFNNGCRVLKLKYDNQPCPIKEIEDFWEDIVPMTFTDIARDLATIEQKRIAILHLGIERITKEVEPKLIDTKTIQKKTIWVDENGKFIEKKFKDTYELYEVSANKLGVVDNRFGDSRPTFVHFVKFKDTSTDREYTIWVDAQSVYRANDERDTRWYSSSEDYGKKINSIQAIAWTIQTNIPKDCIEKIVRQGDCIMIKKTHSGVHADEVRHLTEKEYRELLELES